MSKTQSAKNNSVIHSETGEIIQSTSPRLQKQNTMGTGPKDKIYKAEYNKMFD